MAPHVWEGRLSASRKIDKQAEFWETYDLVCNAGDGVTIFPLRGPAAFVPSSNGGSSTQKILSELQKLCIVLQMRMTDRTHLDFVYSPTDCEFGVVTLAPVLCPRASLKVIMSLS